MPESLTSFRTYDVRFKTSEHLDGSDAMNPDPDYSAAYVVIGTDDPDGHEGHGFVFTCGRGNDVQLAGVQALASLVVGMDVEEALGDMGGMWKRLTRDTQIRWLGPEKGVMHMAVAAVINALWDLKAKRAGKPLWLLLAEMSPEELVDLVDFRYISDALTPAEALEIFRAAESGREDRIQQLLTEGYPAYTTSPGWLGYSDEKLALLCRKAVADGFTHIKLKVGRELAEDVRRLEIARSTVGPDIALSIDANQRWDVPEAIEWVNALSQFEPLWIEEPTSPDDVLGHAAIRSAIAPVPVATGEHVQNRIIFKQLLQAEAVDVVQIDACRVGGVNENVAILLLAAKFGVKVCPHAGGVGLCEVVQHLAMFDFVAITGVKEGKAIEFVDHLHEHFVTPVQVVDGHYLAPMEAGSGATMKPQSIIEHSFPDGNVWSTSPAELVP